MSENFIHQQYLEDISVCDDIINLFNKNSNKEPGMTDLGLNLAIKDSTDLCVSVEDAVENKVMFNYLEQLQKVCDEYLKKYTHINRNGRFGIVEKINIQHYKPGQGFHAWHAERLGYTMKDIHRCLVFMTYLNDVDDGGQTHFYYQDLKVVPRKGLTLIWPAEWTHTHKGIASPSEDKYIVTGWYSFVNVDDR